MSNNKYTLTLDEQLINLMQQAIALQEAIDNSQHGTMLCDELKAELDDVVEDVGLLIIDEFKQLPF